MEVCYAASGTRTIVPDIHPSGRESFAAWRLFAEAGFGSRVSPSQTARLVSSEMYQPLVGYFATMNSPQFAWMVDLEMAGNQSSVVSFKALSVLSNLRSLIVREQRKAREDQRVFDDFAMAMMASRATTEGAFSRFKMLFVVGASGVTKASFEYVSRLPALRLFSVLDTGVKVRHVDVARSHGWETSTE